MIRNKSNRFKRSIPIISLITVTALIGGANIANSAATKKSKVSIWYVNPLPQTPDWGRSSTVFMAGAKAGGYKGTSVGPDKIDVPAMISQIEQAISSKANGIITCPLDSAAFKSVIKKARSKKIVVASIGCVDPNANFSVGTGNEEYGKVSADLIATQTSGKGQVGIIGTDQTSPNQVAQVEGFKAQIAAKYPGMKIVVWESDNSDAAVAAQKIPAMISAYPSMNYLWIIEGAAPGAVPTALKEAGKTPGQIGVLAIDAQEATLKAIEDGWISTTLNQCWFDASAYMGSLIKNMITSGKKAKKFYSIPVDPISKGNLPYAGCSASKIKAVFTP